ncbi:cyclic nucleotide-binding domain-containing protein [Enterococcus sp. N249-2]
MIDSFVDLLIKYGIAKTDWGQKTIPAHTTLLYEGDIADNLYFIHSGALRLWHNVDGKDITFQFFFENQIVASYESFI